MKDLYVLALRDWKRICSYFRCRHDETSCEVKIIETAICRFYKYNPEKLECYINCRTVDEDVINQLRSNGWYIEMHVSKSGNLAYLIRYHCYI